MRAVLRTAALAAALGAAASSAAADDRRDWALTAFGARVVDEVWQDALADPIGAESTDGRLLGVALVRKIHEAPQGLEWEIEGQIARHFDGQSHWEVNLPLVARWTRFPWSETVETGAAFGLGLSFASETPELERRLNGTSQATMVYWMIELAVGAPGSRTQVVTRLHHRSTGYGTFGEDGGANAFAVGLRREF